MKLTIAIPTYNRADVISQSLDSVINQKNDEVEIIVCDNASTDNTSEILHSYINKYGIKYYRSEKNGGMDFNFLNCLKYAQGEYILLFSDDDVLLPGAVSKIIELIDNNKPDYINLNSAIFLKNVNEINEKSKPRIELKEETDLISTDKDKYMSYLGVFLTYLSATIIKRENYLKILNPEKYYGTYFMHAHIVLDTLEGADKKVIITKAPLVAARMDNSGGFNLYEVWVREYKKLLIEHAVESGFSYEVMKSIYVKDINGFIRDSIRYYRFKNDYGMSKTKILFQCTKEFPSVWIKTWPVAISPKILLRINNKIIRLYNEIKGRLINVK